MAVPLELEHDKIDSVFLCEDFVRDACSDCSCKQIHFPLPYLWQVDCSILGIGVQNLSYDISSEIESAFCNPACDNYFITRPLLIQTSLALTQVNINFDLMTATYILETSAGETFPGNVRVRRLGTPSYASSSATDSRNVSCFDKWYTQWRWYWLNGQTEIWNLVDQTNPQAIDQFVLESKYVAKQSDYRFHSHDNGAYVITLDDPVEITLLTLPSILSGVDVSTTISGERRKKGDGWKVRRRPLMATPGRGPQWPVIRQLPYVTTTPFGWTQIDMMQDWELVLLNPTERVFTAVANAFLRSAGRGNGSTPNRKVKEIFRLQNPFIWQKYCSKRSYMQAKGNLHEVRLFHGTQMEAAVKGICQHNFDVRCYGVNAFLYGKGVYFAVQAAFSDKYSFLPGRRRNWMFLACVLVGRSTTGHKDMARPPPLDPCRPLADLYDSCVDEIDRPKLYVIFDSDQCYPEYVISYVDADAPDSD